jgi:hypothetical protein
VRFESLRLSVLLLFLLLANMQAVAQHSHTRVFATAIANDSAGAFMGASSNGSGLYQSDDTGSTWRHLGWNNIKAYSMDAVRSSNGRILFLATGLGVLRSTDYGENWKVLTDWRISEVMDVAVNQKNPSEIYIATAHGPWRSRDGGVTWSELVRGLEVPFTSRIVIDSVVANHVLLVGDREIYMLKQDSIWYPVETNDKSSGWESTPVVDHFSSLSQISANHWIAAAENSLTLGSIDSGRIFYADRILWDSINPLWCLGVSSEYFESEKTSTIHIPRRVLAGGLSGYRTYANTSNDAMSQPELITSVKRVHACLLILDQSNGADYVSIVGTLGDGVFRRSEVQATKLLPKDRSNYVGDQSLQRCQIWSLKSFHIME